MYIAGMKNIYIVTVGDYSDYRICGVYSSKKMAQKYIDSFKYCAFNEFRIEKYPVNLFVDFLNSGYIAFSVRMKKDGQVLEVEHVDNEYLFTSRCARPFDFDVRNNLICGVFAKDEKHAIKIVNERRAQAIANNQWPEKS